MSKTPEIIYLIQGEFDGSPALIWSDDPAPTQIDDPADAVKYYRHDYVDQLEARNAGLEKDIEMLEADVVDLASQKAKKQLKITELQAVVNRVESYLEDLKSPTVNHFEIATHALAVIQQYATEE
ncbi:hypothetical protein KAR91_71290 [Candidatus Pacearchaeota archaeon]|nr:hypothetical protein [Candidatus Pacearchaeota archaeon]